MSVMMLSNNTQILRGLMKGLCVLDVLCSVQRLFFCGGVSVCCLSVCGTESRLVSWCTARLTVHSWYEMLPTGWRKATHSHSGNTLYINASLAVICDGDRLFIEIINRQTHCC